MEQNQNSKIQQAVELFDKQQYRDAFEAFTEAYEQSTSPEEKRGIFEILEEAYYLPNEEDMRLCYEENIKCLKNYPYVWERVFPEFKDLDICLFPMDDDLYCIYDRRTKSFIEKYTPNSKDKMRYFFENLDKPLQVKDEDNFYNLTFLNDNVRLSEDFAGDNHIYLLYSSIESLIRLLLVCRLAPLLEQKKFVFLIKEKNWRRYPINFKKRFGIDYSKIKPNPIRIEEIKRVCFWFRKSHGGSVLSFGALQAASGIQAYRASHFNDLSQIDGRHLASSQEFKTAMSDPNHSYSVDELDKIFHSKKYSLKLDVYTEEQVLSMALSGQAGAEFGGREEFLQWLYRDQQARRTTEYTIKELFCGYFLWQYEKRGLNPRVPPVLLYDPHISVGTMDTRVYGELILSFPYYTCLTSVREPITILARSFSSGVIGWNKFRTQYTLGSDYVHTQCMPEKLQSCYYGFRFEDMKTKPESVLRAVCKHLNIPYEPHMLNIDAPWPDMMNGGKVTRGLDTSALHRDISPVMSEFDQLRLKMFYAPILDYYGYPSFSFKEHPLPENLVRELFKYPFRFELNNNACLVKPPPREEVHRWIQEILQGAWGKQFFVPKMLLLEESTDE